MTNLNKILDEVLTADDLIEELENQLDDTAKEILYQINQLKKEQNKQKESIKTYMVNANLSKLSLNKADIVLNDVNPSPYKRMSIKAKNSK